MTLYLGDNELETLNCIGKGAESKVYKYTEDSLLKIFLSSIDADAKREKIELLMLLPLPDNVVKPDELVYVNGKFAGYKMKYISGAPNLHEVQKPLYRKNNNLSEKDLLDICFALGNTIKELHSLGIVLGDIRSYNFLLKDKEVYFIDIDSWGFKHRENLLPDAYTADTIPPYCFDKNGKITFSQNADIYGYAIVAFNTLTSIHPFDGYYPNMPKMSVTDRMKHGISVLGNHNVRVPKTVPLWNWMSNNLKDTFLEVFEKKNQSVDVLSAIAQEVGTLVYCAIHNVYYNSSQKCKYCLAETQTIYSLGDTLTYKSPEFLSETEIGENPLLAYHSDATVVLLPNVYIDAKNRLDFVSHSNSGKTKHDTFSLKPMIKDEWVLET